jgi:hypothetical protein
MAIPVLPIIKALAPLIVDAGSIVAGLRGAGSARKADDRVAKLEQETLRAGEVISGLAQQMQALAQALRMQAEQTERLQRRTRVLLGVAIGASALAVVALTLVLVR